jgi:hypothetical protein
MAVESDQRRYLEERFSHDAGMAVFWIVLVLHEFQSLFGNFVSPIDADSDFSSSHRLEPEVVGDPSEKITGNGEAGTVGHSD